MSASTTNLQVEDKNIVLNYGSGDTSSSAGGAGITIQDAVSASTDATILWDSTSNEFDLSLILTLDSMEERQSSSHAEKVQYLRKKSI